jgi:2'-5' RNA ligase
MQQHSLQPLAQLQEGQGFYEYSLVAHPNEEVNSKLQLVKESFFDIYKERISIETKPHVTIANFLARDIMEETFIRYLHRIIGAQESFPVTLNNYSGFPPHTVYVRVQDHQPFKQLAASLKIIDHYIRSNGCPEMKFIIRPHLSIARRLPARIYEKAMLDYSQQTFHESFVVNELVLLRRLHEFDSCKQISTFHLLPSAK